MMSDKLLPAIGQGRTPNRTTSRSLSKSPNRAAMGKTPTSKKAQGSSSSRTRSKSPSAKGSGTAKSRMMSAVSKLSGARPWMDDKMDKKIQVMKTPDIEAKGLKVVDLSGQSLTALAASVFANRNVGVLDLSGNNLRAVPPDIRRMHTLMKLDISKNGLKCSHPADFNGLPKDMATLVNLEYLNISECNLPFIPPAVWTLTNLRRLDISRNKVSVLFPEIGNLTKLQWLNLQQTNVTTLPPEIMYCEDLEEIIMWGNAIDALPETMTELHRLKRLAMNHRSFCATIDSYMENLLRRGQIQSEHMPMVLFQLQTLEVLDLEGTHLNNLPEECTLSSLKEFYLNKNFFHHVPPPVLKMAHLDTLDLSNNFITNIPDEISKLTNIRILKMNDNMFCALPETIHKCARLKELELSGNKLEFLPERIGELGSLKVFLLDRNCLEYLPDSICDLSELEVLDLTDNKLTSLPINFFRLKKLITAHSYHKLHRHGLWLHKNPLEEPPEQIWKTDDPNEIYNYLKKLQISTTDNLQRQKLLVLGESQAGKTSLIRAMIHGKSILTNGIEESTPLMQNTIWKTENGVDFMVCDFGGANDYRMLHPLFLDPKALVLIVYDHRKYTPARHYQAIGYWLDLLNAHTPGVVVKLIGTQSDLGSYFIESTLELVKEELAKQRESAHEKLQEELLRLANTTKSPLRAQEAGDNRVFTPTHAELQRAKSKMEYIMNNQVRVIPEISVVTSVEDAAGVIDLTSELEYLAINPSLFPHAQRQVPKRWYNFCLAMKRDRDNHYLEWPTVEKISEDHDIKPEELQESMEFLRDTGEILWFDQDEDLKKMIFHRPSHLIEIITGLYRCNMAAFLNFKQNRVLASRGGFSAETFKEAKENFLKYGQVSRALLQCLWFYLKLDNDNFDHLVELAPKLDLCYNIPQTSTPLQKNVYVPFIVLPWYVKDDRPRDLSEIWPEKLPVNLKEICISFTFPLHYPEGLFEKLSVRLHNYLDERIDWQNLIYGKTDTAKLILKRFLHPQNYDMIMSLTLRGSELGALQKLLSSLYAVIRKLMALTPGLLYYVGKSATNCGRNSTESFPPELFQDY